MVSDRRCRRLRLPLFYTVPEADAIVSVGSEDEIVTMPVVGRVIGDHVLLDGETPAAGPSISRCTSSIAAPTNRCQRPDGGVLNDGHQAPGAGTRSDSRCQIPDSRRPQRCAGGGHRGFAVGLGRRASGIQRQAADSQEESVVIRVVHFLNQLFAGIEDKAGRVRGARWCGRSGRCSSRSRRRGHDANTWYAGQFLP